MHYRMTVGTSIVLVPAGSTTNSEQAVFGEVLIPVGQDLVAGQDDFNSVFELTRPNCTTGGSGGGEPDGSSDDSDSLNNRCLTLQALAPIEGEGFVASGADIGPGLATFGVSGFAPGEQVVVTLFSTPRELGTVTADASGNASITFEVLGLGWCR